MQDVIFLGMPSRNALKKDIAESFYHVYARGSNKQPIFIEPSDYDYFLKLFARYLSTKQTENKAGRLYPQFSGQIDLLAFCLMGNHFHLLLYQTEEGFMPAFMRSLMTSYSKYFNLKYRRTGPLFESRYKAARITSQSYLEHISRYIHLNPRYWKRYRYSSLRYYLDTKPGEWLKPEKITSLFKGKTKYMAFLEDYEDHKQMLEEIKHELADR